MKVVHDWLKEYIGDSIPSAEKIEELLTFHAFEIEGVEKVGNRAVIDVDVLPNRSSDCLCHRGIAREIATLTDTPLVYDPLASSSDLPKTDVIAVTIEDTDACPRFTASLITGVKVGESPAWLRERLEALGQRSINNIVDATNYVMLAIGQPLHAYDAEKFPQVDGKWQFVVRAAKDGETISLLAEGGKDEQRVVELKGGETLIVDGSSNTPIGLAGVKGGAFAGVDASTTKIIVEAAHFDPLRTRKTARGLGIVIDASKRFENNPSIELPPYAQAEIAKLIADIASGTCEGMIDVYQKKVANVDVVVSSARANALLGLDLSADEMQSILARAGIAAEVSGDTLSCTGPFERTDLQIEEDVIEEIGRIYGYDKVKSAVPEAVPLAEINVRHYYSEKVRAVLIDHGFSEVITSSFRKKDVVQLKNALASDKSFLRSSLTKNITEALDQNATRADLFGALDTRIFEIGTVFQKDGDGHVIEHVSLALGVRLKAAYTGKEDKLLKSILTELEKVLGTSINWSIEKGVAECNFTGVFTTLPKPTAYDAVPATEEVVYKPFSIYPHMSRDIALWVSEGTEAADVETVLNDSAGDLRIRTDLFDEFTKDGRTSYAFRLVFQSKEKTLTDDEINAVMDTVYKSVEETSWEVR